jgi:hypothetical protein
MSEAYAAAIGRALPRLLGLFDRDATSASHGFGDRRRWAWKLTDFGNATFQGAAHGLARLWVDRRWPYPTPEPAFLARIDSMFDGARRLTRADGSLEEAFPHEGSFCVTALVAFDLLVALELLHVRLDEQRRSAWRETVAPMIGFLQRADETHAFIANHLATACAALRRWHALSGDAASEARARMFLRRILDAQSSEGWFEEYGGFDAGYQTLCTGFLADVHAARPDWGLADPLARSVRFLWQFAHPDGSLGGLYGSRATRFYFPAGIEALANELPEAAALADHLATSIALQRVVGLDSVDEPNLVPMFNAYCDAAATRRRRAAASSALVLPALAGEQRRVHHAHAGLLIDAGPRHYTIVSTHKGGVVAHFRSDRPAVLDGGVVLRDPHGRWGSSQSLDAANAVQLDGDVLTVDAPIRPMPKRLPSPAQFLLLRLLCLTAFRVPSWREAAKRALVRMLITRRDAWPVRNRRRIRLGEALAIEDATTPVPGYERVEGVRPFVAIHMASQGYWQVQDEGGPP